MVTPLEHAKAVLAKYHGGGVGAKVTIKKTATGKKYAVSEQTGTVVGTAGLNEQQFEKQQQELQQNIAIAKTKPSFLQPSKVSFVTTVDQPTSLNGVVTKEIGNITHLTHSIIKGDELQVKISVKNTSKTTQEYRAFLYTNDGQKVDKEPDTFWKNIKAGNSWTFTLTSSWKPYDVKDFGGAYKVSIMAQGNVFVDERVVSLTTGEITDPEEKGEGTIQDPESTTPAQLGGENGGLVSKTPPLVDDDNGNGFLANLFKPTTGKITTGALIIGGVAIAYLLGRKK